MARLANKEEQDLMTARSRGKPSQYPWDTWADGQQWTATEGEDFTVPLTSFRGALQAAARARGMKIEARKVDSSTLTFRFVPDDGHPAAG